MNSEMLCDRLKPAIWSKWKGLLSEGALLLHYNAHPHIAAQTVETLKKLNFKVLEHPTYSPDIAPLDYHLFGPLKQDLKMLWVYHGLTTEGNGACTTCHSAKNVFFLRA
jgi:hypothetical protein